MMKTRIEDLKVRLADYFSHQIYNFDVSSIKIEDIIEMSIEDIREHTFVMDNINYVTFQYLLQGAPKQQIFNDINLFINYYIITCINTEIISDEVIKTLGRKSVKILNQYKGINEDLWRILIDYITEKLEEVLQDLVENEEFESCSNLYRMKDYFISII